MNRRTVLSLVPLLALAPSLLGAGPPVIHASGLAEAAMDQGKTVVLDFRAGWCPTCARQERVPAELKAANPGYEEAITFFQTDWDEHAKGALSRSLTNPRRSTLVALKGRTEIARIVAGTGKAEIMALLDAAPATA